MTDNDKIKEAISRLPKQFEMYRDGVTLRCTVDEHSSFVDSHGEVWLVLRNIDSGHDICREKIAILLGMLLVEI